MTVTSHGARLHPAMGDVAKKNKYQVAKERRFAILAMKKSGLSVLQISRTLEISPQAVYQHIYDLRAEGLLPSDAA